jgi:hypothetical protein
MLIPREAVEVVANSSECNPQFCRANTKYCDSVNGNLGEEEVLYKSDLQGCIKMPFRKLLVSTNLVWEYIEGNIVISALLVVPNKLEEIIRQVLIGNQRLFDSYMLCSKRKS